MKRTLRKQIIVAFCLAISTSNVFGDGPTGRMYAQAVGSSQLEAGYTIDNVEMILNNTEDRVGARAKLCRQLSDSPCERVVFNFPELRFDKDKGQIFWASQPVALFSEHGMRVTVEKQFHLGYEVASNVSDAGFDKGRGKELKIYLEPAGSHQS